MVITGCSTVYVPLPITHPAEINLSQYETIAFGRITGDMASDIKFYLNEELIKSSHIRIMDGPQQFNIIREKELSDSYNSPNKKFQTGGMTRTSMLIIGKAESFYDEDITFKKKACKRKNNSERKKDRNEHRNKNKHEDKINHKRHHDHDDEKYDCTHYKRKGVMSTFSHIDFTEAESGQLLLSKNFKCKKENYKTAIDENPAAINIEYMYQKCLNENVQMLFKTISPWQEFVKIPFEKDSRLPILESGIYLAQEGNLLAAIDVFSKELQAAESNSNIPNESLAKVYWNLGLAYEYSWQFEKADGMFRRANGIIGDSKFIREIAHNQQLKAERAELLKQIP